MATNAPAAVPSGPSVRPTGGKRSAANNKKFAYPLPIILPLPPNPHPPPSWISTILTRILPTRGVEVPTVIGRYDPTTRSVWITDPKDVEILFCRGFFGKGSLSRSELNWRGRRLDLLQGGESLLAEQIREKRRKERKQFKIDRAAAMLDAAKTAEAVLTSTLREQARATSSPARGGSVDLAEAGEDDEAADAEADEEGEDETTGTASIDGRASPAPSASTTATSIATTTTAMGDVDISKLTPQTFLVRPARPDSNSNRNRGRKAFRRRPPASTSTAPPALPTADPNGNGTGSVPAPSAPVAAAAAADAAELAGGLAQGSQRTGDVDGDDEPQSLDDERQAFLDDLDELVPETEHLQLGLEETWFLAVALGVLKIYDPDTDSFPPPSAILSLLLTPTPPSPSSSTPPAISSNETQSAKAPELWPDDPFLISYAAYHHFRSLGWVVKPGIKFSCDWLLYRRGPAFSHSAFSCVLIPVYADPQDQESSPHALNPWFVERSSWKWMNTIMRVNALVQKTVVLVYVTVPPLSSFQSRYRAPDGSLDVLKNDMRSLLERYPIQEVVLQRFSPARRRD